MKTVFTFIFIIFCAHSFAQKAFEFKYYYGKTKNFEIKLSLANGYILGSEIVKTDLLANKKVKYLPLETQDKNTQKLVFLPDVKDTTVRKRKRDHIILYKMKDDFDVLPDQINGAYGFDLKTSGFKLYKQKPTR
ncbi:hypothetical protein [Pedobacter agri]|uniref:hypothetical protein n=1 Tax=Pedobacter agri TaxID=454586 RepID=UPI0010D624D6|nr:hypothetical protein [Pedobacter agri]RYD74943.1 MAG: hypothetical protein EOP55_14380 [Sphingobacteriales bacterium]